MNVCRAPKSADEFAQYFQLRWQILRKPWQQELGSEQDDIEAQSIHRMVVNEQGQVLAVGRLDKSSQHQGQIRFMAVQDNCQGQALGQQIIAELEQQAQKLGIRNIQLNARDLARGFYQKLGYVEQGFSHRLFDDVDHYKMTKSLSEHPQHQAVFVDELQSTWHSTIPMSKAMAMEISYYDQQCLLTHCDADFNKNLHNTMFAGSIYTLATLTGWGWVYLALKQAKLAGDIVLAEASIKYKAPIKGVAYGCVESSNVSGATLEQLQTRLQQGKNARVQLTANIYCGERVAAIFTGNYAVLPQSIK